MNIINVDRNTGQARRLLKCYVNKLARGKDIVCFERYLMKNMKWD